MYKATMGSGDWLKNIITLSRVRKPKSKKMKMQNSSAETQPEKPNKVLNDGGVVGHVAATRIQTAYRAYMARKALRQLKGVLRLQTLTGGNVGKKQTSNTLMNLQLWSKIQSQIRSRRLRMVEEGGMRQKKLENQLKLETKLRDLETEWSGGADTMDEALARMQQREAAAVKRERAMAYAFSHQSRPGSKTSFGPSDSELTTANWDWSWLDRWIVARPWESRVMVKLTPKKVNSPANKSHKNSNTKSCSSLKMSPNGKKTVRNGRLSYRAATKNTMTETSAIATKQNKTKA